MNEYISKYNKQIDEIVVKFNYNENIKHLLYIIIPAFMKKYNRKDSLILNTFKNVPIIISNKIDKRVNAYYISSPRKINNNIITSKCIVINNYKGISLITLLDDIVHEYNHAINSYNNEINVDNNVIKLRTGLTFISYDYNTLKSIKKDNSYILEEVINTKQTEEIINIIKKSTNFSKSSINNTVYAINGETNDNFESNAYYLETKILNNLLNNKTFTSTLEILRLDGNINDIEDWFNNITGINDSYNKLINYLNNIINMEHDFKNVKFFKNIALNKIKKEIDKVKEISDIFNHNCY